MQPFGQNLNLKIQTDLFTFDSANLSRHYRYSFWLAQNTYSAHFLILRTHLIRTQFYVSKVIASMASHCTTTRDYDCYFIPDKSYGRSVSDMKCVRSLVVPSLHTGILPQELNLDKMRMFTSVRFANVCISVSELLTWLVVSPECHSAWANVDPGPVLESTSYVKKANKTLVNAMWDEKLGLFTAIQSMLYSSFFTF